MKILVLLKQTPDTEAKIQISGNGKEIESSGVKYIVNPYDEFAIEEAIKTKEKNGSGEVIAISVGRKKTQEGLIQSRQPIKLLEESQVLEWKIILKLFPNW